MNNIPRYPSKVLDQAQLRQFFISHLNRIYCAKSQLADKLPELARQAHFLDLKHAIQETIDVVLQQIERMKEMYILLDAYYQPESCTGLVGLLDEAFQSIGHPGDSAALRELSILFYMQNIESIEIASFKTLQRVAGRLEANGIVQLLAECYDEAKEDKILFREISENYI